MPVTEALWFVALPDRDAYLERFAGARCGSDPSHFRRFSKRGEVPGDVEEDVYRFHAEVVEEEWQALWVAGRKVCLSAVARKALHQG